MGKWRKDCELQKYLNGLKKRQDHQYSRRMSFYRIKPDNYFKVSKADTRHYLMMGVIFILVGVIVLVGYLYSLHSGVRFAPGKVGLVAVFGVGVLYILAGVKSRKRAKR